MLDTKNTAQQYWVNSVMYKKGETAEIAITDVRNDRYVAISIDDEISYRPLAADELAAKAVRLEVTCDMTVKFYRYGFFIDDQCVMAGDTDLQRIVLSDFLPSGYDKYYCFGYDVEANRRGCMCATNDVWKIYHDRYVYTGYYQVQIQISENANVQMLHSEVAYQAAAIPTGAFFPVCDALHPQPFEPVEQGQSVHAGTYYVKAGTIFTDGKTSYEITQNVALQF